MHHHFKGGQWLSAEPKEVQHWYRSCSNPCVLHLTKYEIDTLVIHS